MFNQSTLSSLPTQPLSIAPQIIVPTHPSDADFLVSKGQYDGVVQVNFNGSSIAWMGSGALLSSGLHILTAAHVVADDLGNPVNANQLSIEFKLLTGATVTLQARQVFVHQSYAPDTLDNDIAIIELMSTAPLAADRYELYRGNDELGQVTTHVGYGSTGTGSTGRDYYYPVGVARYGDNTYDLRSGDTGYNEWGTDEGVLLYDFDDGSLANDVFGDWFNINHRGVGEREVNISGGDSGGPGFIDGKLAGIHSWGTVNNAWGGYSGDTRVSHYANWIDAVMQSSSTPSQPTPDPQLESVRVSAKTMVLTFNQAIDASVKPKTSAFTVLADGSKLGVKTISINENIVTLTLNDSVGYDSQVLVSYKDYSSRNDTRYVLQSDDTGVDLTSFSKLPVTNDTPAPPPAPRLTSAVAENKQVVLTFDQQLDASVMPKSTAFTLTIDGKKTSIKSLSMQDEQLVLTLSEGVGYNTTIHLSYKDYSSRDDSRYVLQNEFGSDLASFSKFTVGNLTPEPPPAPTLMSVSLMSSNTVKLTFNQVLDDGHSLRASLFTLTADGSKQMVKSASVDENSVILTLRKSLDLDANLLLSYKDYTSRDDTRYVVQNEWGTDLSSFNRMPVDMGTMQLSSLLDSVGLVGVSSFLTDNSLGHL